MSQARKQVMSLIARYAHDHTNISPFDVVAYYQAKSMYLPAGNRQAIEKEAASIINDIRSKDPEEFEDYYSDVLQQQWDARCKNEGFEPFNYFEVCQEFSLS